MKLAKWTIMVALLAVASWALGAGKTGGKSARSASGSKVSGAASSKGLSSSASKSNPAGNSVDGQSSADGGSADRGCNRDSAANGAAEDGEDTAKTQSRGSSASKNQNRKSGTVDTIEGHEITFTGKAGKQQTLQIPEDAAIQDMIQCEPSDLQSGEPVRVWGSANEDGTFSAERLMTGAGNLLQIEIKEGTQDALSGTIETTDPLTIRTEQRDRVRIRLTESGRVQKPQTMDLEDIEPGDSLVIDTDGESTIVMRVQGDGQGVKDQCSEDRKEDPAEAK